MTKTKLKKHKLIKANPNSIRFSKFRNEISLLENILITNRWLNQLQYKKERTTSNLFETKHTEVQNSCIISIANRWKLGKNSIEIQLGFYSKYFFNFASSGLYLHIMLKPDLFKFNMFNSEKDYNNFVSLLSKIGYNRYIIGNKSNREFIKVIGHENELYKLNFNKEKIKNYLIDEMELLGKVILKYF